MKRNWAPTQDAFRKFLTWLDQGVESGGERYLEMRRRLTFYFDRKNCTTPDELADETLSRVAQKLDEKGTITGLSPIHYCYVVAKFVFLEYLRRPEQSQASLEDLPGMPDGPGGGIQSANQEKLECLELCLNKLPAADRELILEYYQGELRAKIESRARLAQSLGLSTNALSIRACRIRQRLELCVRRCCMQA
ncbi:MAG TPA: sigma-70 family RNA polymerase sigma factor [Candidatus Angelobacter sp.]|nr:sigma-70 family RNA polymerase sigma factor [Candidatus Angelobacter sp.]